MENYIYQNTLIGKKQLREILAWSFTNYDSMQACSLADELKYLGFKYASQAGISISIEDLKIPFVKNMMLEKANEEILNSEKLYLKGKLTEVERFQKIIDTWSLTSESLKDQIIYYFKNYDPLNSVYIMAFSGARGNLSQVRQLVGMRGLMSDPSGQIMNLPIKKNFREGLTITDYLMSGYGARKGIVDTALKTANSGYLTRRLIDVAQDILIREKDCLTTQSFVFSIPQNSFKISEKIYQKILGRVLTHSILNETTNKIIIKKNTQITPAVIKKLKKNKITTVYVRSPLTCKLYRAICQKCYGWDLATEHLVDIGEAIGILAGQSIGEPGTQLTMRTFHTGGIFTSEARQQIISPLDGTIQFYKFLKTVILRTNRGEDVLVTKNSGSLVLIPFDKKKKLVKIDVLRNTILFPKNNQYILKDTVIGELINQNKQIKTEIKPILSDSCGEIFIPRLKQKLNLLNNNKLIWILAGQLYNSPLNSFLNFYPDYKINKNSSIFRTKILNHYTGFSQFSNMKPSLQQGILKLKNKKYSLFNSQLKKLEHSINSHNYLLKFNDLNYFVKLNEKFGIPYLQQTRNHKFATLITNAFLTSTGGKLYYDFRNLLTLKKEKNVISFLTRNNGLKTGKSLVNFKTIIWLEEEIHKVNCEQNILLVDPGDFISQGFELIPGLFSKTSGLVSIVQKNNVIKTISIKPGLVYESQKFKNLGKKVYYPGETLFSNIPIKNLSFCEQIVGKTTNQLLIRPLTLYEVPLILHSITKLDFSFSTSPGIDINSKVLYTYKSNQVLKGVRNLNLVSNILTFKTNKRSNSISTFELKNNRKLMTVDFALTEKLLLTNYMSPNLRYKDITPCFLIQENQFISNYTILGYLESITSNSLEIVKFKMKKQKNKQIFLITNDDCVVIKKTKLSKKKLNEFVISNTHLTKIGKILIENDTFLTIQKGKPYFFPNCRNQNLTAKTPLQYKLIPATRIQTHFKTSRNIQINYYNISKLSVFEKAKMNLDFKLKNKTSLKSEFSKLFIKNNGKLYSCLIPQFIKKFSIKTLTATSKFDSLFQSPNSHYLESKNLERTILMQSSNLIVNENKEKTSENFDYQLTLLKFVEQPFLKSTKSVGLYAITEDYFEQEANSVFCKNTEFIEAEKTIGLLSLEKEITGDIVQGLPRIEEILEARKKNIMLKRIPTSQKKGLLIQKTSLDINFEFRKLGTPIQETDKINPHKLLKVYFNYYGLLKYFICNQSRSFKSNRLLNNYEGSYKSFKKVQLFILNSVQGVYRSQGVTINDKHLEIIIKQMTTKVLITYEGQTPLLRREVIDLYHIQYINQIIQHEKKEQACYIPLLLGITKAALNNPSFISAASFQETTRVLTKAAIEGRIDWLRGLKENIIIGHLIPAGTGSQNYRNCFKKPIESTKFLHPSLEQFSKFSI